MDKIRLGIVGVGTQGSVYAAILSQKGGGLPPRPQHVALGALCDNDPAKKKMCAEQYPDIPFFEDWHDLADFPHIDAVITTVPHYLHPEIAIYCLRKGVNVIVEKPAGVYAKSVSEMNRCAAEHPDVAFGIMFNQRTNKLYRKVKEIVASGDLGTIRRSNWIINSWWRPDSYYRQSDWRATWGGEGGGVLVNQAPHQLDLWQWICGVPNRVWAKCICGAHRAIAVENDVTIVTQYPSEATGCFVTCTHDPHGTDRLEIDLDKGKIVVEDSKRATVWRYKQSEDELNATMSRDEVARIMSNNASSESLFTMETFENTDPWGLQHTAVLEDFALHIIKGTPLLAPGSEGINGVNLANAALLSSWLEKEVDNPVDEDLYLAELNKRITAEGKYPAR